MSLARKLNLKPGMTLEVIGKPAGVDLDDVRPSRGARPDGILLFVKTVSELDTKASPVIDVARRDGLAWIAYPKGGQLDTDLNRDILWGRLEKKGIQGVRQVSIDDVWSALRFRPK
jgi:hypothetical protein